MVSGYIPIHHPGGIKDDILRQPLLEDELQGVSFEFTALQRGFVWHEDAGAEAFEIILTLEGTGILETGYSSVRTGSPAIIRIPYGSDCSFRPEGEDIFSFLRVRKDLDKEDLTIIHRRLSDYRQPYIRLFSECPVYTEDIKSDKTLNRMLLPQGLVPRVGMGLVETPGPDTVAEHDHPMLDQAFLGLEGCRCTVHADGKSTLLTEGMLLHIPLGSRHSVTVEKGDMLRYLWMDFFLTHEGEKYMEEQHHVEE